jgi:hypothetical protein
MNRKMIGEAIYIRCQIILAYVNNIQITWKTTHLSVFYRTNSPSIDQSRAEGNTTECVGKKRNGNPNNPVVI